MSVSKTLECYAQMQSFEMNSVIAFILKEKWAVSRHDARISVDALLQWLAGHAAINHRLPYVMMEGPVDKAFHAFILNTRAYYKFCEKHIGFFVNHTPLDATKAREFRIMGGIEYTFNFLEEHFGDQLSPLLRQWKTNIDLVTSIRGRSVAPLLYHQIIYII